MSEIQAVTSSFALIVPPEWLDYNNHMNVAYYSLAFDQAGEAFVETLGMGAAYTHQTQNSWMVLEAHLTYQQEARLHDSLHIETRVLDFSDKLAHLYQVMYRGTELLSTQEQLTLHVNLETRRAAPFPAEILAQMVAVHEKHHALPPPIGAGRQIGIDGQKSLAKK